MKSFLRIFLLSAANWLWLFLKRRVPRCCRMRILLDEDMPRRLGAHLIGHEVSTVPQSGWAGTKNGTLLALAATRFDVFVTMDQNIEFQQNLATLPVAVLVVRAMSNRIEHLKPLVPKMLTELMHIQPRSLRYVDG